MATSSKINEKHENDQEIYKVKIDGVEMKYVLEEGKTPYFVSGDLAVNSISSFSDAALRFSEELLINIRAGGFDQPTSIQQHAMPQLMAGLDTMCCAHTRSGKTASYLLPIINLIMENKIKVHGIPSWFEDLFNDDLPLRTPKISTPAALILVPTRELAEQIAVDASEFTDCLPVRILSMAVFGGDSVAVEINQLKRFDYSIVVATPGRLLHLLTLQNVISLKNTKYLVIDEADELFEKGFFKEVGEIIRDHMLPTEKRMTTMLSATFPLAIQNYARQYLRPEHVLVVVGMIGGAAPDIVQEVIPVTAMEKRPKLEEILKIESAKKILIFCNRIEVVDGITYFLEKKNYQVTMIHSELEQATRDANLLEFNEGRKRILVATSVAARGLNIKDEVVVLNYEFPREISDYIQRIGRARSGVGHGVGRLDLKFGRAISFFDEDVDEAKVEELCHALRSTNTPIPGFLKALTRKASAIEETEEYKNANEDMKLLMKKKSKFIRSINFAGNEPDEW